MAAPKTINPKGVTGKYLASVLGITPNRVSQLVAEGVLTQDGTARASYDLAKGVQAYIARYRRSRASSAKEKLAVQQERKLRLQNDREAGELVRINDAADVFLRAATAFRSGATALPRRVAERLANAGRPGDCRRILEAEIAGLIGEFERPLRRYFDAAGHSFEVTGARVNGTDPDTGSDPGAMG